MMYRKMTEPYDCASCVHDGKQYFDEPCDNCDPNHCAYEEIVEDDTETED